MQTAIYVAGGVAIALGAIGGASTPLTPWYRGLKKPSWQPPEWLFGPAWTAILACGATAAVLAWNAGDSASRTAEIIAFAVNAVYFLAWSPLFFMLRRPDWALVEVIFLWASVVALIVVVAPLSTLGCWLLVPYLAWVSFATVLNRAIVLRNAPFAGRSEAVADPR
ncbi:TspO/MBR family protein [Glacieibacterium sp.]|uniref:TspO/MBR family protein n=1 Tax=Glacieibacterium sp. TaxID=2860237 RepID=UPI003B0057D5